MSTPTTSLLVLSLFPGIGLFDMAFEEEGFCVVRGPDVLWGGDVRRFHPPPGVFGGVIGGPPCQLFSALKRLNPRCGEKHGNLIPEFERVVLEAMPAWFCMENVRGAPQPNVAGFTISDVLVRDVHVGGETQRLRRFSFGTRNGRRLRVAFPALYASQAAPAVCSDARVTPVALRGSRKKKPGVSCVSSGNGPRLSVNEMLRRQGAPSNLLDEAPFTDQGKRKVIGNGVPLAMGRSIARAVKESCAGSLAR